MTEPVLHHYPISPFAEKVRAMLGFKGLAWKSVQIPLFMPKPDVVALTGGYRKTPTKGKPTTVTIKLATSSSSRAFIGVQPRSPSVKRLDGS